MAYSVPPLPYDYSALEPHIDADTMRIHHDKHHQAYVDKVNAALEGTEFADKPIADVVTNLSQIPEDKRGPVRNNGGGHLNHSLFWEWLSPDGGGEPGGDLASAIESAFGSFDDFKTKFKEAGVNRSAPAGPGWCTTAPVWRSSPRRTRTTRSPTARHRCSASTSGSTRTTSSTRTASRLPRCDLERDQLAEGRGGLPERGLSPVQGRVERLGAPLRRFSGAPLGGRSATKLAG